MAASAVDHKAQEDALRMQWSGSAPASVFLLAESPLDLSRESNGDVMLVLTLRPESVPAGDITLGMTCGAGCSAKLPLHDTLSALPAGQWTTLGVPLKCFAAAGADVAKVERVLSLETAVPLQLSVSRIALGAINEAEQVLKCATSP